MVDSLLADEAIVIVDDWRYADDSKSFAKQATLDAIKQSKRKYKLLYELPSRFNGDKSMWWNGVAVFSSIKG